MEIITLTSSDCHEDYWNWPGGVLRTVLAHKRFSRTSNHSVCPKQNSPPPTPASGLPVPLLCVFSHQWSRPAMTGLAMTLLHPSSCPSNTISLQVHPIFFAWGHLSSHLRPALLEDFITFLYQLGQVQIRDRSSGYLNSPPHQKQSSEGAWHDQKAIRPLYRIKEELNVRLQDGLGTGQCHSPSPVGSHGTHMVTGALTSVQCCSRRGAVHVDWTLTPSPSEGSDMW